LTEFLLVHATDAARRVLATFECRSSEQTFWLQRHARKSLSVGTTRVFVVTEVGSPGVVAYYGWCTAQLHVTASPPRLRKGGGRYPQPIALLARLGVDTRHEGRGLGAAVGKARTGAALGNPVLQTEGRVTLIDGVLAAAVLAGLVINAALNWWWADPMAGYVLVYTRPARPERSSQTTDRRHRRTTRPEVATNSRPAPTSGPGGGWTPRPRPRLGAGPVPPPVGCGEVMKLALNRASGR
jgi:hypothetical protein